MKVFMAGPRAVKKIDENIITKIKNICNNNYEILIGDADGIDSCIQKYLNQHNYKNVTIFASNGLARNNYGNWRTEKVKVNSNITGFEYYAVKDFEMAKNADIGFMIWNGKSRGTFNNMINLLKFNKIVILYYIPNQKFYKFKEMSDLYKFINSNINLNNKLKKILPKKEEKILQMSLF